MIFKNIFRAVFPTASKTFKITPRSYSPQLNALNHAYQFSSLSQASRTTFKEFDQPLKSTDPIKAQYPCSFGLKINSFGMPQLQIKSNICKFSTRKNLNFRNKRLIDVEFHLVSLNERHDFAEMVQYIKSDQVKALSINQLEYLSQKFEILAKDIKVGKSSYNLAGFLLLCRIEQLKLKQTQFDGKKFLQCSNLTNELVKLLKSAKYIKGEFIGFVRVGAVCWDGWLSLAIGRGAGSHHGGVYYWILARYENGRIVGLSFEKPKASKSS